MGVFMKSVLLNAAFAAALCLIPTTAFADSDCDAIATEDHCENQTWTGWWPFSVYNCLDNTTCKKKEGADRPPKCYPFYDGTCKCAGKNPLKKRDGTSYAKEIESEEGIILNALEYWQETFEK